VNRIPTGAILAVVVVLAGCTGGGGPATASPPQAESGTGESPASATDTPAPDPTLAGGHPAANDGTVNVTRLLGDHLRVLSRSDSFTVGFTRTATYVANGSLRTRGEVVNRASLAAERLRIERRSVRGDGRVEFDEIRYANATTSCLVSGNGVQCGDGGVDPRRIVGLTVETTPLETLAAPAYAADGVVQRNGQSLYRYSASSFRSPLPSGTERELFGEDPSLVDSTLLVHPSGRIVTYTLTYRITAETPQELALAYSTSDVNATTVVPPRALD
jgi:hypothetical protein